VEKKQKKFKQKALKDLLSGIAHHPMLVQQNELNIVFQAWKGKLEQVDDITIVGIRV
jgi:hypothetical protein